jgi:hypothetical protein
MDENAEMKERTAFTRDQVSFSMCGDHRSPGEAIILVDSFTTAAAIQRRGGKPSLLSRGSRWIGLHIGWPTPGGTRPPARRRVLRRSRRIRVAAWSYAISTGEITPGKVTRLEAGRLRPMSIDGTPKGLAPGGLTQGDPPAARTTGRSKRGTEPVPPGTRSPPAPTCESVRTSSLCPSHRPPSD